MAAPQDPDLNRRIDVSLNIIGDAHVRAIEDLTKSVSALRELIAASGMTNPAAAAQSVGQAGAYTQPSGQQAGIWHGRSQPVLGGDQSNPSQNAQASAQSRAQLRAEYDAYLSTVRNRGTPAPLSPQAETAMMNNLSDFQRMNLALREKRNPNQPNITSAVDRFFQLYPGVQRDPGEDRTNERVSGMPPSGGSAIPEGMTTMSGTVSSGASFGGQRSGNWGDTRVVLPGEPRILERPWDEPISRGGGGGRRPPNIPQAPPLPDDFGGNTDGGGPAQPGWVAALDREGINPESRLGLTIPRLGEFTIQDKLNMYAQWVGRSAMRRQDALAPGEELGSASQFMGRSAAGAAYLRDQSATLVAVGREFQRLRNFARGQELAGEDLGFSRESALGDVELGGMGFRLNLGLTSAAQREGIHQEFTRRRVQAAPGVSGEEAQRIKQLVAGMGYSGDLNANLQMNMFRNLQQRGISAEAVAPLVDQGIRQGNSSVAALRDIIYDLADAARHAHMTVAELATSTAEYAEQAQTLGANYEDALRNAAIYTRMGVDPRIMGQAQQSPMVQGILSARTGLTPNVQGILGAPAVAQGIDQAVNMALGMGGAYANMPDQTITTPSGRKIPVATGRDAQIAFAAQQSGVNRQIVERIMRNPTFLEEGAKAATMADEAQRIVGALTNRSEVVNQFIEEGSKSGSKGPGGGYSGGGYSSGGPKTGHWVSETVTKHRDLTDADRGRLQTYFKDLEAQMIEMDPQNTKWTDRVRKISKDHGDVESRIKVASRIIGEANETKPEPDYLVGLTDEAYKFFKIEKPKDRNSALPRANAGGAPANSGYFGPNIPGSTGGAMTYGKPGP